jgi:hypothetical protein
VRLMTMFTGLMESSKKNLGCLVRSSKSNGGSGKGPWR